MPAMPARPSSEAMDESTSGLGEEPLEPEEATYFVEEPEARRGDVVGGTANHAHRAVP